MPLLPGSVRPQDGVGRDSSVHRISARFENLHSCGRGESLARRNHPVSSHGHRPRLCPNCLGFVLGSHSESKYDG